MNNEEKILAILEKMDGRLVNLETGQVKIAGRLDKLEADVAGIKEDVSEIKADVSEIRTSTNHLIDWAERAEPVTRVKLFPNAK